MDDYTKQTDAELQKHLSSNPPDTPVWIMSQNELLRRREEHLTKWTRTLAISTMTLVGATLLLVICTAMDVYLHFHR